MQVEDEKEEKSEKDKQDGDDSIPQFPLLDKKIRNKNGGMKNWIHLDPCEAAVNENLIYESWGRSHDFVFQLSDSGVIDVTEKYTTKYNDIIERRLSYNIDNSILDEMILVANSQIEAQQSPSKK